MDFAGQGVVVVGGTGGIGSAIAQHLAERHAGIALFYHSNLNKSLELVNRLAACGAQAHAIQVDVTQRSSVEAAMAEAKEKLGEIDVLINCAGISRNGFIWNIKDADWAATLDTNLTGTYLCMRAAIGMMMKRNRGRVINLTSIVGKTGVPGTSAYAASKAGVEALSRTSATEVAKRGITVNALALGYIDAGIIEEVPAGTMDRLLQTIPVGRLGHAREVCETIEFLCSEGAAYITGQVIEINGGLHM